MATARLARAPLAQTRISGSDLVLDHFRQALLQLAERHVLGAAHVAVREFLGFAHVDHHRPLAVDELHGILARTGAPAVAPWTTGHSSMAPEARAIENQHPVVDDEFHGLSL